MFTFLREDNDVNFCSARKKYLKATQVFVEFYKVSIPYAEER